MDFKGQWSPAIVYRLSHRLVIFPYTYEIVLPRGESIRERVVRLSCRRKDSLSLHKTLGHRSIVGMSLQQHQYVLIMHSYTGIELR